MCWSAIYPYLNVISTTSYLRQRTSPFNDHDINRMMIVMIFTDALRAQVRNERHQCILWRQRRPVTNETYIFGQCADHQLDTRQTIKIECHATRRVATGTFGQTLRMPRKSETFGFDLCPSLVAVAEQPYTRTHARWKWSREARESGRAQCNGHLFVAVNIVECKFGRRRRTRCLFYRMLYGYGHFRNWHFYKSASLLHLSVSRLP